MRCVYAIHHGAGDFFLWGCLFQHNEKLGKEYPDRRKFLRYSRIAESVFFLH